jgi:hypothetical protein
MAPDAAAALLTVHEAVSGAGGDFRVTDAYRLGSAQASVRRRYETWVSAGKPPPYIDGKPNPAFDAKTMKAAFAAKPGESFHGAGRSIDASIGSLKFPDTHADMQLDRLWDLVIPLGWRPVIREPTEGASESWHFDFMGEWKPLHTRLGYAVAAMCATLDIGEWAGIADAEHKFVQAQLHRAGYDVGAVDGDIGPTTKTAISWSGWHGSVLSVSSHVAALPSSSVVVWRRG